MKSPTLPIDAAIIGGGVAGLWALTRLRQRGYSAVLFESRALGSGQSIDSQGIIHGGAKFALGTLPGPTACAVAGMPDAWRACLAGDGDVDLRACRVLSPCVYLVSPEQHCSAAQGDGADLCAEELPPPLRGATLRGRVQRLDEPVLDMPSLLAALVGPRRDDLHRVDRDCARLARDGTAAVIHLPGCTLAPAALLLTAGSGNERLLRELEADAPAMQRRPLQQVLVRHGHRADLYAHWRGTGDAPQLTVTSHRDADGNTVWYLGGELAAAGAGEDAASLIRRARDQLHRLLPGLDLGDCHWETLHVDRAEAAQPAGARPDDAFLGRVPGLDNVFVGWPTKLALCPVLGRELLAALDRAGIRPRHRPDLAALRALERPAIAVPAWARVRV